MFMAWHGYRMSKMYTIFTFAITSAITRQQIVQFIDSIVSTINPAVLHNGSNNSDTPPPQTNPHICNKSYSDVDHHHHDLVERIATCQSHTHTVSQHTVFICIYKKWKTMPV